jgi:hypothetical protein
MRRKVNPNIEIFQQLYKNSKPKCKGLKNHTVKKKREDIRILEKRADALFQIAGKKLFPISVTGEPTEVIHHFVPKSQSNNLRYDFKNACPATNGWHYRHHTCSDPTLTDAFRKKFGQKRIDYLTKQRHISVKQTKERLDKVIEELNKIVFSSSLPF